jgi:hypothetical protein
LTFNLMTLESGDKLATTIGNLGTLSFPLA